MSHAAVSPKPGMKASTARVEEPLFWIGGARPQCRDREKKIKHRRHRPCRAPEGKVLERSQM